MEKYSATCRLILVCNNPCKVIAPIRSRCLCFRIAAPTHEEVASVLQASCPPSPKQRLCFLFLVNSRMYVRLMFVHN